MIHNIQMSVFVVTHSGRVLPSRHCETGDWIILLVPKDGCGRPSSHQTQHSLPFQATGKNDTVPNAANSELAQY